MEKTTSMFVDTKKMSYEDFLKLPETKKRYEIIDGQLVFTMPPSPQHQVVSRNLFRLLDHFVVGHALGEVLYAPLDVVIHQDPMRTRQPDLLFVSHQRRSIIGKHAIEGGPDLVVEILSASVTRLDVEDRLEEYGSIQVQECWLVSPEAWTVEVLQRTPQRFERAGLFGLGDAIISTVLPDFRLRLGKVARLQHAMPEPGAETPEIPLRAHQAA
jgi:Uma2 family endonuclease